MTDTTGTTGPVDSETEERLGMPSGPPATPAVLPDSEVEPATAVQADRATNVPAVVPESGIEPATAVQPEPTTAVEPAPTTAVHTEPTTTVEPAPTTAVQAQPVAPLSPVVEVAEVEAVPPQADLPGIEDAPPITGTNGSKPMEPERFRELATAIETELAKLMVGQTDIIRMALMAMIGRGHVLLEGVPGLGKTVLVRSMASALHLQFSRVQFTPDLMPGDVTGSHIVTEDDEGHRRFEFQPGPLFTNLLLADEINRATPKTQSALLEAMQERQVTTGDATRPLPNPFFVLATQNPLEHEGTYPLPEAQLDRFFFKLIVPMPDPAQLVEIASRTTGATEVSLAPVATGADLAAMADLAREVPIASHVLEHAARLITATHPERPESPDEVKRYVRWGSSPRGMQTLVIAGRIRALLEGRFNVAFDDLAAVAPAALRHRVFLNFEADAAGVDADAVVAAVLASVPRG